MRSQPLPVSAPAFRVAHARLAGATQWRLRSQDLQAPHHGMRSREPPKTHADLCLDYAPALLPGQAFSHATAARLWGLPLPPGHPETPLHVSAVDGREPRRPGIVGHRLVQATIFTVQGLPVVSPIEAWCQCGETLSLDALVALADALMGRWSKLAQARLLPESALVDALASRAADAASQH
ncbi:hypothetical protein [Frondihabitans australicus]|uniref:hypothetical protein n=1 Tax=Frondihabitans australicus TaxID=386892 RepID=UPI001473C845|nr:hypothetical protein [Frondihabitans australicus]